MLLSTLRLVLEQALTSRAAGGAAEEEEKD